MLVKLTVNVTARVTLSYCELTKTGISNCPVPKVLFNISLISRGTTSSDKLLLYWITTVAIGPKTVANVIRVRITPTACTLSSLTNHDTNLMVQFAFIVFANYAEARFPLFGVFCWSRFSGKS